MILKWRETGMLSKNNYQERLRKMDDKQERFSIRKFSVGAASVLVGTAILSMQNVQTVHADTTTDTDKWEGTTESTSKSDEQTKQNAYTQVVSEDQDKAAKTADTTMEGQDSKVASFSVPKNAGAFASKSADANQDKSVSTTDTTEKVASDATKSTEDNKADVAANNNAENKTTTDTTQKSIDNKSTENTTTDTQNVETY